VLFRVGWVMSGGGIPQHRDAVAEQAERHGPLESGTDPVAGLRDAEDLAGVTEG
jgi:hypothetical protein